MLAGPEVPLEDEIGDVLGKAMRGLGLDGEELARRSGLPAARVQAALAGAVEVDDLAPLAAALELREGALAELAGPAAPEPPEVNLPEGIVWLNTAHPVPGYAEMTVNSYLYLPAAEPHAATAFDTGSEPEQHLSLLRENGRYLSRLFLTHTHHDHICAHDALVTDDSSVYAPQEEPFKGAAPVVHQQSFLVAGQRLTALRTSGHSPGGMSYRLEGPNATVVFVGDAIFCRSIGKVPAAAYKPALRDIAERLLGLPGDTILCPGHGPLTTVAFERAHNPFFPSI